MYIFIFLNLLVGFYIKNEKSDHFLFLVDYFQYAGIFLLVINFIAIGVKSRIIPSALRYDLFSVGAVLFWFSYWPPFFRQDSPVFYVIPLYFAFMTAGFSLLFLTNRERVSLEDINQIKGLPGFVMANPVVIMMGVIISLFLPQHFMLFPITITLLVIRYSLACCLDDSY